MPTTKTTTLQKIQDALHIAVENDYTTPAAGSEDWNLRLKLINVVGVASWEQEKEVEWNELWSNIDDAGTIEAGVRDYDAPDDIRSPGSKIALVKNGVVVELIPVKSLQAAKDNPYSIKREAYIYGSPRSGHVIRLGWIPAEDDAVIGATMSFSYYKAAEELVRASDIPEMSDAMYCVYSAAAIIHRSNYNSAGQKDNEDRASYSMEQMRSANFTDGAESLNYLNEILES